uniref:Uncharacterized protein n=1 Tax=Arundo donax TaxID=35708 RepID=A0A0A9LIF8_ARUDO
MKAQRALLEETERHYNPVFLRFKFSNRCSYFFLKRYYYL